MHAASRPRALPVGPPLVQNTARTLARAAYVCPSRCIPQLGSVAAATSMLSLAALLGHTAAAAVSPSTPVAAFPPASALDLPQAHVLLTGYLPWANFTVNPAGEVASALDKSCIPGAVPGIAPFEVCFSSLLLPVNETGATQPAEHLMSGAAQDYDAVLHSEPYPPPPPSPNTHTPTHKLKHKCTETHTQAAGALFSGTRERRQGSQARNNGCMGRAGLTAAPNRWSALSNLPACRLFRRERARLQDERGSPGNPRRSALLANHCVSCRRFRCCFHCVSHRRLRCCRRWKVLPPLLPHLPLPPQLRSCRKLCD